MKYLAYEDGEFRQIDAVNDAALEKDNDFMAQVEEGDVLLIRWNSVGFFQLGYVEADEYEDAVSYNLSWGSV